MSMHMVIGMMQWNLLTIMANKVAKDALMAAVATNQHVPPTLPFEGVLVFRFWRNPTSSIATGIYWSWGRLVAWEL